MIETAELLRNAAEYVPEIARRTAFSRVEAPFITGRLS